MPQSITEANATQTLESLTNLLTEQHHNGKTRRIPPLEKWSPSHCGDMDLVIKANGDWIHEGRKMTRQSMLDLFSSVLWAEDDLHDGVNYFLKTPVEKIGITVEDVPLQITQVDTFEDKGKIYLEFTTPHGDKIIADDNHPILLRQPNNLPSDSPPQPYILVRQNGDSKLYGRLHRNVFFHLINLGELKEITTETGTQTQLILQSGNSVFNLTVPNE